MGLSTSHSCFQGSHSQLHSFRNDLARQTGITLEEIIEYSPHPSDFTGAGMHAKRGANEHEGNEHDTMPLLWHSDYNGGFSPRECKNIAHGLNDILQNIKTYSKNKLSAVLLSILFTFAFFKKKAQKTVNSKK